MKHYIGIDVSKSSLDVHIRPEGISMQFSNSDKGIQSLVEILGKYSEYLVATNTSMNNIHYSDKSARSPENSSTMYQISACECNNLNGDYIQLNDVLHG